MSSSGQELIVDVRDRVMWITINRPDRRNAVNDEVTDQICDALTRAESDRNILAIVLTGSGDRAFCSGADLAPDSGSFQYDYSRLQLPFARMLRLAQNASVPLIARVNGHCVAGGLGLLGMCDMAIAVDTAKFGMPEVKVGVFPMQILTVLSSKIPKPKLYELSLTGELVSAADVLAMGLVNYVVPPQDLDGKVEWLLGRIVDKSPSAIRRGKFALRHVSAMNFDDALAFMESQITLQALTEDAAEGRRAFIEKRPPNWKGR